MLLTDPHWQTFMEQTIRLLYFLAESPDQLCSRLLQRCSRLLLDQIAEREEGSGEAVQLQAETEQSKSASHGAIFWH